MKTNKKFNIIAIIVIVLVIFVLSFLSFSKSLNDNIDQSVKNVYNTGSSNYDDKYADLIKHLKATASKISTYDTIENKDIYTVISDEESKREFTDIKLFDLKQNVIVGEGEKATQTEAVKKALEGEPSVFNIKSHSKAYTQAIMVPVEKDGKITGILQGTFEIKEVANSINDQYNYITKITILLNVRLMFALCILIVLAIV